MPANTPYYTDDQWAQMMKLQDLTGQEQQIARQQAMSQNLREGGSKGIDKGSQIGQALRGIGSGLMDYKSYKDMQGLSGARKDWLGAFANRGQGGQQPIGSNLDYTGFE